MNISLTPELEAYIHQKVKSGMYHSSSEVIREGLRLLKEQDTLQEIRLEALRTEVRKGIEQLERGEYTVYHSGEEVAQKIKAEGRKRLATRRKAS